MISIRNFVISAAVMLLSASATVTVLAAPSMTEPVSAIKPAPNQQSVEENTSEIAEEATPSTEEVYVQQSYTPEPAPTPQSAPSSQGDYLSIPSIGLTAPITPVGLTADGAIDVPDHIVGRWNGSAQPGDNGATFLDGHVATVFGRLNQVQTGQIFTVTYGGQSHAYRVVHTETVSIEQADMARALSVYGGANHGINIMTCAGSFIPSINTYDHRFIVYAVAI